MTMLQMYLFTRLDIIHSVLGVGCIALFVFILFAPPFVSMVDDTYDWPTRKIATTEIILGALFSIFVGLKVLIPTQKEMAAIIVVPAIANNEQIQQIGKNGLDLTVMASDYLKTIMETKAKEERKGKANEK